MLKQPKIVGALLVLAAAPGCSPPESTPAACGAARDVVIHITTPSIGSVVPADTVEVRGTATHGQSLALQRILVNGVLAAPLDNAFDLSSWRALVPSGNLTACAAGESDGGLQCVTASAFDVCGGAAVGSDSVSVRRREIQDLAVSAVVSRSPDDPPGATVPQVDASGRLQLSLRVTAGDVSLGTRVQVVTVPTAQVDVPPGGVALGRDADGSGTVAFVTLRTVPGTVPGPMIVRALAEDQTAETSLEVVGPPVMTVDRSSLGCDQSTLARIVTRSPRLVCLFQGASGVSVNYIDSTGALDTTPGLSRNEAVPGRVGLLGVGSELTVNVRRQSSAVDGATLGIRCSDAFGQETQQTITVQGTCAADAGPM